MFASHSKGFRSCLAQARNSQASFGMGLVSVCQIRTMQGGLSGRWYS